MAKQKKDRSQILRAASKRCRARRQRQAYNLRAARVLEALRALDPIAEDGEPQEQVPIASKWELHRRLCTIIRHHGYEPALLRKLLGTSKGEVDALLSGQIRAVKQEELVRFCAALEIGVAADPQAGTVRKAA